jgi:ATP-dependent Clp protease ATP-binding subunit ClpC
MSKFNFDILNSSAYKQSKYVVSYEKGISAKVLRILGNYVFPISVIAWITTAGFDLILNIGIDLRIKLILGMLVVVSALALWILWFWHDQLVKAKTTLTVNEAKELINGENPINLAECLDPASGAQMMARTVLAAKKENCNVIDPVFLFVALSNSEIGRYLFIRIGFNPNDVIDLKVRPIIENLLQDKSHPQDLSDELYSILEEALEIALSVTDLKNKETINAGDIIVAAFKKSKFFQDLLVDLELKIEDIVNIINWYYLQKRFYINLPFWDPQTVISGIGDEWSFGYANLLSRFATDWTRKIASVIDKMHTYGCSDIITRMERVLSRGQKNNVLLVGEHGIGRQPSVNGLIAKMIKRETLPELHYKKVFKIDVGALLSGVGQKGEVEARLTAIMNEALYAGNIILFIEDIDNIFSAEEHTGSVNASSIILPYLRDSGLQIIGTTTPANYHKNIEANPGIANLFEKIDMKEPSNDVVISVLEDTVPKIEYHNKVIFFYKALREAVNVSERYIYDKPFPAKAISLVDDTATEIRKERGTGALINSADIDKVASQKVNIPIGSLQDSEKTKLLGLEEFLHQRVIGQDEAIKVISDAMRRVRSGLTTGKRPIGVFLFLGPTGVGKTETARALAQSYFGSEKNMIRLDMSEFAEQQSIYRLIGAPPAAGQEGTQGQLTKAVKDSPFSLILLDELEKAHPDILNVFLQVFDDGRLTDGTGKTINFTNTIIIATSNAGSELIREAIQKGQIKNEMLKEKLLNFLQSQGIFRPEFLNRFDAVVAFHPLNQDQLHQIVKLMINGLNKTLSDKEITIELDDEAIEELIKAGYDPAFGARPLRRALQDKVENLIAKLLLSGKLNKGEKLLIKASDIE